MKATSLTDIISYCLNIRKKNTIIFITNLVELILRDESIKPCELAKSIKGFRSNKLESKAKRIRDLLSGGGLENYVSYAKYVISLFGLTNNIMLAMDRTNWERGTKCINYLILSIIWDDVSLPIYWIPLNNKSGNSDSETRIDLLHNRICHAELVSASIFAYSRAWILKQVQYDRFLYLLGYAISLINKMVC